MLLRSAKGQPAVSSTLHTLFALNAFQSAARSLSILAESRPDAHSSPGLPASIQSPSAQAAFSALQISNQRVSCSCTAACSSTHATEGTMLTHIDRCQPRSMLSTARGAGSHREKPRYRSVPIANNDKWILNPVQRWPSSYGGCRHESRHAALSHSQWDSLSWT